MTELELYKFLRSSNVSCFRIDERETKPDMYLVWIYFWGIEDFIKLMGDYYFDEGGLEVNLQKDCICVDLNEFCIDDIDEEELKNAFTD